MVDGYGMTEAGTVLGMPLESSIIAAKAGSVGFAGPLTHVRLVDGNDRDVADDEAGELLVKGPNVTPGYWGQRTDATHGLTADGWMRTGDIGRRDHDGFIYIVDRTKDIFISGGENVYPVEVEAALNEHPDVKEVAVIGIPDTRWGEVGLAYVVLKQGSLIDHETLAAYCSNRLARYKVPKQFHTIDTLPRTASGKIMKTKLRDWARSRPA